MKKEAEKKVKAVKEKKVKKSEKKKKGSLLECKKELLIGIVFVIAIVVCITFLVVNSKDDSDNNSNSVNEENNVNNVVEDDRYEVSDSITEKDIVDAYGVSMEDAKSIVKANFNSDNFEYSVEISTDATYIVIAKNVINKNVYKFEVNPMTKRYVEL